MAVYSARPSSAESLLPRRRKRSGRKGIKQSLPTFAHHKPTGEAKPTPGTATLRRSQLTFVYVGNLRSDVQNADLEKVFSQIGKITQIDIRCGFGTGGVPTIGGTTVYATVLFSKVKAATRALVMDGHTLLGNKIVVSASFLDMPEAKESARRKNFTLLGFNLTKIGDAVHRAVNKAHTGGTQVFVPECA
ncbi:hypothetical protein BJV78DRAFT_1359606 [Lactifluus subvellereus]|nr:hypothetical protein BJV78DRAFT_1359606 [Lactifluus subvellereus]